MPNLDDIQQALFDLVDTAFVQPVVEQGVPDSQTVKRNAAGDIQPYIALQFGDMQQGHAYSFAGARGDDYILPLYFQCLAPTPQIARSLYNKLLDVLLGVNFPWSGDVRKRPGGGMFTMTNSNGATECYLFPASFGVLVQFDNR